MDQKIHGARFKASMLGLEAGDIIVCERNKEKLHSVVLKRRDEKGCELLTISCFSPILTLEAHPKDVSWDETYGGLADSGGRVMLLSEEWESTEKEGAKLLLTQSSVNGEEGMDEKAKAILAAMKDRSKDFEETAEEILKKIGHGSPSQESVKLLTFALICASKRVWDL